MYGDIRGILFALGVLAPRDMAWLWAQIATLCHGTSAVAGRRFGLRLRQHRHAARAPEDAARGAGRRGARCVRPCAAWWRSSTGAVGPSKDCAYEGPILKAITGCPIAMEGKSATCAHFSPVGNIASAMCDLWSNEIVQNVRLLSGNAPGSLRGDAGLRLPSDERRHRAAEATPSCATGSPSPTSGSARRRPSSPPKATIRIAAAIVAEDTLPPHRGRRNRGRGDPARRNRGRQAGTRPARSASGWSGSSPRFASCRKKKRSSSGDARHLRFPVRSGQLRPQHIVECWRSSCDCPLSPSRCCAPPYCRPRMRRPGPCPHSSLSGCTTIAPSRPRGASRGTASRARRTGARATR